MRLANKITLVTGAGSGLGRGIAREFAFQGAVVAAVDRELEYQTTKAGIIGLTRSIAAYYAKFGIRANVLAPGLMESKATEKVKANEDIMSFMRRMQPLGEFGTPEDAAMAAVYLGSEESHFVTGQVLAVDGGWTMQ